MASYRAFLLDEGEHILSVENIDCEGDSAACRRAQELVTNDAMTGRTIELWDHARKVARLSTAATPVVSAHRQLYTYYVFDPNGHVATTFAVEASSDDQAQTHAIALLKDNNFHKLEVWSGTVCVFRIEGNQHL